MSVSYGKGDKAKATRLHSLLVRSRGRCERCGSTASLQAAHIVRRNYATTRTNEQAAWCLCASCHWRVDNFADDFMDLVDNTLGRDAYFRLKAQATEGVKVKVDWAAEVERLSALLAERGAA